MARRAPPPRVSGARRAGELYERARLGLVPAEVLSSELRWRLVAELHRGGWSDAEIADHTRTTRYTVSRIRGEMGLRPNPQGRRGGMD